MTTPKTTPEERARLKEIVAHNAEVARQNRLAEIGEKQAASYMAGLGTDEQRENAEISKHLWGPIVRSEELRRWLKLTPEEVGKTRGSPIGKLSPWRWLAIGLLNLFDEYAPRALRQRFLAEREPAKRRYREQAKPAVRPPVLPPAVLEELDPDPFKDIVNDLGLAPSPVPVAPPDGRKAPWSEERRAAHSARLLEAHAARRAAAGKETPPKPKTDRGGWHWTPEARARYSVKMVQINAARRAAKEQGATPPGGPVGGQA